MFNNQKGFVMKMVKFYQRGVAGVKSMWLAAALATAAVFAPMVSFAQSTSPGAAIASELSSGKSDVMLVIAAAAVIIGVLVLWAYVKRAR